MRTISERAVGRPLRITRLTKAFGGILLFATLCNPVQAAQSVTLAWDSNADINTAGYNLYYGAASRTYTNVINSANVTSATIGDLIGGVTYFFAVTAYNNVGLESDFSGETSYTVAIPLAILDIHSGSANQFVLTVAGPIGHRYTIQATQDFQTWTTIGTVSVPAGGSFEFTDTKAQKFSRRFYRTQ